ncbi:TPA: hypothetical protein NPO42_000950 [Klebsiella quasipneumoniae subsp. similipneumoniae]|nr:hypothetical protein [Klebsiella quasipneumoniae subsp. similipneumoniae]
MMATEQMKEVVNFWGFLSQGWPYAGAISIVWITHLFARSREKKAIKEKAQLEQLMAENKRKQEQELRDQKQASELRFIGSQLIFILESFAISCADVAVDKGKKEKNDAPRAQLVIIPSTDIPEIILAGVEGDWRALQAWDMYRIMELPVMLLDTHVHIRNCSEHLTYGNDSSELIRIRARYVTPLGLRAASLARRLRRQCGFPASPLSEGPHSVSRVLLAERKRHIKQSLASQKV